MEGLYPLLLPIKFIHSPLKSFYLNIRIAQVIIEVGYHSMGLIKKDLNKREDVDQVKGARTNRNEVWDARLQVQD